LSFKTLKNVKGASKMKKRFFLMLVIGISLAAIAAGDVVDIRISGKGGVQETTDPWSVTTTPITPTNQIDLLPSEWVSMDIIYTDDAGGSGIGLISLALDVLVTGPATLYIGEAGDAGDNTLLTFPPGAWDLGKVPAPISFIGVPAIAGGYVIDLSMDSGLSGVPGEAVVALDHLLLHCDGSGPVTVTIANDDTRTKAGGTYNMAANVPSFGPGVTITQIVPEPMTVALLGLGGLFIRRKRTV
jgi:hypothetical protein